jgi:SAM-dependent methyltransferase
MRLSSNEIRAVLREHLARWGLKRFTADTDYFAWQRQRLSHDALNQLHTLVERRRGGERLDDIAFYDLAADPTVLPVLYSQRYDYFEEIGSRVAGRLHGVARVLDFGCGPGILTTFYASRFPDQDFMGIDRSSASVAAARRTAKELGVTNVRFECADVEAEPLEGSYDVVVSTHALVQAEQDPGVPSASWRTFERLHEAGQQAAFEARTGIGIRLDRLSAALDCDGRMIICEKTRQLARRVPFQRALAARNLHMIEQPESIRYRLVEAIVDDGPVFVLGKRGEKWLTHHEWPEPDEGRSFDQCAIGTQVRNSDEPLYENHWPSAQRVWEGLESRKVLAETTRQGPDGCQLHVEFGTSGELAYLYCANTFDQRQIVIVELPRIAMIEAYYQEIFSESR